MFWFYTLNYRLQSVSYFHRQLELIHVEMKLQNANVNRKKYSGRNWSLWMNEFIYSNLHWLEWWRVNEDGLRFWITIGALDSIGFSFVSMVGELRISLYDSVIDAFAKTSLVFFTLKLSSFSSSTSIFPGLESSIVTSLSTLFFSVDIFFHFFPICL